MVWRYMYQCVAVAGVAVCGGVARGEIVGNPAGSQIRHLLFEIHYL